MSRASFPAVEKRGGIVLLTADHGNCEKMYDETTHGPHTAHTLERVPVLLVGAPKDITELHDGKLADVAPTLLAVDAYAATRCYGRAELDR